MSKSTVIIYTDGAARGNPGPAAIGVVISDEAGNRLAQISRRIGSTTNNQAEYRAVIAGLEQAVKLGAGNVKLYSDSELVINQILGRYKVKNAALRPLYNDVVRLIGKLQGFSAASVPRGKNSEADGLANEALDRK